MARYIPNYAEKEGYGPQLVSRGIALSYSRNHATLTSTAIKVGSADKTLLFDENVTIDSVEFDLSRGGFVTNFKNPYKGTQMNGFVPLEWCVKIPDHLVGVIEFEQQLADEEAEDAE